MPKNNDYAGALDEQANEQQNGNAQSHAQRVFRQPEKKRQGVDVYEKKIQQIEQERDSVQQELSTIQAAVEQSIIRLEGDTYYHAESGVAMDNRGVIFEDAITRDDFDLFALALVTFFDKTQLWIGDMVLYAVAEYGIKIENVARQYHLDMKTVYDYKAVCEKTPRSIRHDNLTYTHYRMVRSATYNKNRAELLALASDNEWNTEDFAQHLDSLKVNEDVSEQERLGKLMAAKVYDIRSSIKEFGEDLDKKDRLKLAGVLEECATDLRNM